AHHGQGGDPMRHGLGQIRLRRVLDHLHARLDQPIDLTEAAHVAGCSVSHFAHLFKTAMGVSPMRYLREQRMLCARELVETTGLSMCEIGLRVGMPEPAQFSQAFRAHWKTAPSSLRRAG
ncbi:AraC family transcriptional regulator, partial [Pelomonas sp. HMWF004]